MQIVERNIHAVSYTSLGGINDETLTGSLECTIVGGECD
jgi:hypothetical protein